MPLIGLLAILAGIIMPPASAYAQAATTRPPLNLTTSPIPLSVTTKPGTTVTADLRVKNNNTDAERLKVELLKFSADNKSGDPQLHEREAKDTYFDWVSFSENSFVAEPGIWKTVKMTIKAPPTAAFGYYMAVLFSRATPDKPTGGGSAAVQGGVASLVLLDVDAPGARREAKVSELTADRKVYEFLPANLNIRLRNSGNVHVAPTGSIFIKRGSAQVGKPLEFNTARGNILPGSSREFTATWNDGFPSYVTTKDGSTTKKSLRWDFSKLQDFRIGHYTATLVAVYDGGQRDIPVEATVGFWVIPWRILGFILLILLLSAAGIILTLRGIWKKIRPPKLKPPKSGEPAAAEPAAVPAPEPVASLPPAETTTPAAPTAEEVPEVVSKVQPASAPVKPKRQSRKAGTTAAKAAAPKQAQIRKPKPSRTSKATAAAADGQERKTAPELKD